MDARGGTALFAGVVKCAGEVRKFASKNRVNRIILLSDGQANEGPSSPAQLGALGASLATEGISVATVGLGVDYNEDLMVELALRSDGSHAFVQHAADLARFLDQELGAVAAVVARDVEVKVLGAAGTHPLRVLGRRADVVGQTVTAMLGKVNGGRQHVFVIEMDVDPMQAGSKRAVADVEIAFRDLLGNRDVTSRQHVEAQFTKAAAEVEAKTDPRIMSELGMLSGDDMTQQAFKLRDQGDVSGAQRLLQQNAAQLEATANKYKDKRVIDRASRAKKQANELSPAPAEWNVQRKAYKKGVDRRPPQRLLTQRTRSLAIPPASPVRVAGRRAAGGAGGAGRVGGPQRARARRQRRARGDDAAAGDGRRDHRRGDVGAGARAAGRHGRHPGGARRRARLPAGAATPRAPAGAGRQGAAALSAAAPGRPATRSAA